MPREAISLHQVLNSLPVRQNVVVFNCKNLDLISCKVEGIENVEFSSFSVDRDIVNVSWSIMLRKKIVQRDCSYRINNVLMALAAHGITIFEALDRREFTNFRIQKINCFASLRPHAT